MKINQVVDSTKRIENKSIDQAIAGKWYQKNRIYILKANRTYRVVTLNFFDRFVKTVMGNRLFFRWKKLPNNQILTNKELSRIVASVKRLFLISKQHR